MKKIIKSRIFLIVILCIISCSIGVYAANTYKASDVVYNANDGSSMSVNEALNELYNLKINSDVNYEIVSLYVWNNGTTSYSSSFELDSTKSYILLPYFAIRADTVTYPSISSSNGKIVKIGKSNDAYSGSGYWYSVKNASTVTISGVANRTNTGIIIIGLSY